MVKAQNRLIGVIANSDIYGDDDDMMGGNNMMRDQDSSADKLSNTTRGEL